MFKEAITKPLSFCKPKSCGLEVIVTLSEICGLVEISSGSGLPVQINQLLVM